MIRKNQVKVIMVGMLVLALIAGCGLNNNSADGNSANDNSTNENSVNEESDRILSMDMKNDGDNAGEQDKCAGRADG